jgi:hypothetical protein
MNAGTARCCKCGQDLSALAAVTEAQSQAKVDVTTQAQAIQEGLSLPQRVASGVVGRCTKCGGPVEDGFLYSIDSVGEHARTTFERIGWMAGSQLQERTVTKIFWVIPVTTVNNPRHEMTASRCASCGLVELYAR